MRVMLRATVLPNGYFRTEMSCIVQTAMQMKTRGTRKTNSCGSQTDRRRNTDDPSQIFTNQPSTVFMPDSVVALPVQFKERCTT